MEYREAAEIDHPSQFGQDVANVFELFSLPRMEYHSREETGFWESVGGLQFVDFYVNQWQKNLLYIVQQHFDDSNGDATRILNRALGNYMGGPEAVSVTFYRNAGIRDPVGLRLTNEFDPGEHTATVQRTAESAIVTEDEVEEFDWLYGVYSMERTDAYGETSFALTVTIRNTRDAVTFSAHGGDYRSEVREWDRKADDSSILPLSIYYSL